MISFCVPKRTKDKNTEGHKISNLTLIHDKHFIPLTSNHIKVLKEKDGLKGIWIQNVKFFNKYKVFHPDTLFTLPICRFVDKKMVDKLFWQYNIPFVVIIIYLRKAWTLRDFNPHPTSYWSHFCCCYCCCCSCCCYKSENWVC